MWMSLEPNKLVKLNKKKLVCFCDHISKRRGYEKLKAIVGHHGLLIGVIFVNE